MGQMEANTSRKPQTLIRDTNENFYDTYQTCCMADGEFAVDVICLSSESACLFYMEAGPRYIVS